MFRKLFSGLMLTLFLTGMLTFASNTQSAECGPRRITVPDDFKTIQEAINNATFGDTIFVRAGTYYGSIIVNKTVSLIGENKNTTVLDGNRTSIVVNVTASSMEIGGFTITGGLLQTPMGGGGIYLSNVSDCRILDNNVVDNLVGICAYNSTNITIENNLVNQSIAIGIFLFASNKTITANNEIANVTGAWPGLTAGIVVGGWDNMVIGNAVMNVRVRGIVISGCNNTVAGNTLKKAGDTVPGGCGIYLSGSINGTVSDNIVMDCGYEGISALLAFNNTVSGNIVKNSDYGINLDSSFKNTISNNKVLNNLIGIRIPDDPSFGNIFRNNDISDNRFNLWCWGASYLTFQDIDTSNIVDGKPVIYWVNQTDKQVPLDAGFVALINCKNIMVKNLTLANNSHGVILSSTKNSTVEGSNISFNHMGIELYNSKENRIMDNNVSYNLEPGLCLVESNNNTLYHNMLYKNGWRSGDATCDGSVDNVWDDGYPNGGNYWTDYRGVDEKSGQDQDQPGSDGIGDTPYIINANNTDRYPSIINREYGQSSRSYYELNWTVEQLPPSVTAEYNGTETILHYNGTEGAMAILSTKFHYPYEEPAYEFYYDFMWSATPEFKDSKSTARYSLETNWTTPNGKVYPLWDQHWWEYKASPCYLRNPYYNSTIDPSYEYYYPGAPQYEEYWANREKPWLPPKYDRRAYDIYTNWTSLLRLEEKIGSHIPTWNSNKSLTVVYSSATPYPCIRLGYEMWETRKMTQDLFSPSGNFTIHLYVCFHPDLGMQNGSCTVRVTSSTLYAKAAYVQTHPIKINDHTFNIITKSSAEGYFAPRIDVANVRLEQDTLKLDVLTSTYFGVGCEVIIPNDLMWCLNATNWKGRYTYYSYYYETPYLWPRENGTHAIFELPLYEMYGGVYHFEIQSTYVLPGFQFNAFDVVWNETSYQIYVVSNSTVSNFQLDTEQKIISFNVSGDYPTTGFCKVTIPNIIIQEMWQGNYTLLLNGEPWPFINWTDSINTHIYFTYQHSEHEITIIPEFPMLIPLLALIFTTLTAIITKKKLHKILSNKTKTIQNH